MPDRPPLVLTVYPPIPPAPKQGRVGTWQFEQYVLWVDERLKEEAAIRAKRLTDAELAAEYHSQCVDERMALAPPRYGGRSCHSAKDYARIEQIALTLWRFATHPHYDERRTDA